MLSPPAGSNALGVLMTRSSSHLGENLGYWIIVFVACGVFLLEARRARSSGSHDLMNRRPLRLRLRLPPPTATRSVR